MYISRNTKFAKMRNTRLQFVTAGKNRQAYQFAFKRKDAIMRNIQVIIACIIAFVAGTGLYEILK